jgi:hypothetical protein
MAATVLVPQKLVANTLTERTATVAIDATDGGYFPMSDKDHKYLVIVENAHATVAYDFTIKAGDGIQGLADYLLEIPAAKTYYVAIESGMYKVMEGTNKGRVMLTAEDANIKVAVVILP